MSLLDAYEEGTLQTAKAMDAAPLPEPVPEPKHSAWTVVPRALAGAALEVAGNLVDVGSMIGQVAEGETRDYGDFEPLNTRPEASRPHYEMAREMRPDPLTAGLAENVIFGVGKGLTKAAFAVTAGGVIPGAAAFGLSEGMTTSEDLAEQGVDADTRQKVGTVTGVVSGASVLLPIAGTSLLKTAGLVAAGGPAAYIAQETIIKDILEEADYQKIADQHDPLDPVGLAVSTLLPAAFGAMAMRGAFKGKATQEELDAAMVHNTTIKADQFEAETPQAVEAMKQAEDSVKDIRATYEHTGDIGKVITEKLMDMGITPQEAADKGLLWDSFFKSMESKTGEDAQQLFGKYFDRVFNAGEDLPPDAVMQGKSYGFDQIQTPEFKAWSGDAPFIPREEANVKAFKTGEPVVVEAYHGTGRPDRVGETFKKSRATSGPMAFHTSNPELASGYASGKQDTSLALEDQNYSNWFKFKPKGERSPIDIERAWHRLDPETKAKIEEIAPTLRQDEDGNVISDPGNTSGNGSYDYNLSETRRGYDKRGNPLKALVEDWLNSGVLYDDEEKFMQVLQQAGFPVKDVAYDSPHAQYPFVYKNFIRMKNPLVTDDIPQSVIDALNTAAKRDRSRAQQYGADLWDKNTKTLKEWVQYLNDPSTQQHAWTSIPDKVTKILKELGYDGIIDESGKNGGEKHPVYIPFEENQVKSAIGNKGKFGETSNILKQSGYRQSQLKAGLDALEVAVRDGDQKAIFAKALMERPDLDAKQLTDDLVRVAETSEGDRSGNIPALVPVLSHMRRAILDDPKILDSIVRSVPVDMVNNLFGSEAAAKVALHDQAMLKDSSAFNADLPVSGTLGDTAYPVSLLVREVAFSAAKATRIALDAGLEPSKADSALIATNGDGFSHRGSPRAFLEFGQNNKMSIGLLASADRSSFLHESGHFFLEVMDDLARQAEAPEGLKADIQSIYDWMGVKPEQWAAMTLEEKRPFHEQWARGFEQYLMEGKAPNSRLKEAFARFRDWLIEIYKSATALNVTLSDDVRQVMDRMLTVKESEPRQSSTGDGVPPPRASIGETSAGTSDLDKALTSGEPLLDKIRPLDDPDLVSVLQDMAANEAGWAERGGNLMREFGDEGEVTGRTQWIPKAEWWPDRPGAGKANRKLNEGQVAEAVRKHMAGEPLKPLELQTVEYMSRIANDRLNSVEMIGDQEFANTMQDAHDEGLAPSTENVFDSLTVARAKEMNPQAFDEAAAAYELHDDDMIFMEQMRSIINDGIETSTQADQGGGSDTGAKADPIAAEAERIVAENPERRIPIGTGPDGEEVTLSLREYIDEARAQADQARQDVNLIKAAAECLLGQL